MHQKQPKTSCSKSLKSNQPTPPSGVSWRRLGEGHALHVETWDTVRPVGSIAASRVPTLWMMSDIFGPKSLLRKDWKIEQVFQVLFCVFC